MTVSLVELRAAGVFKHVSSPALAREVGAIAAIEPSASVVVTGIGHSAGPARYLASLLSARFVPMSAFLGEPPKADVLVVFSQHLCPNAHFALSHHDVFARTILFTSDHSPHAAIEVVRLPPSEEKGTLLRILGPSVAMFAAAQFAGLQPVPEASRAAPPPFDVSTLLEAPLAFVAAGEHVAAYRALAWKLVEAWSIAEPPVWDVLEFAHGPYQQLFGKCGTVIACESSDPRDCDLFDRLARVLAPSGQQILRLRSIAPRPLALLEHDAMVTAILLAGLRARPRDLTTWEGMGLDAPLYELAP